MGRVKLKELFSAGPITGPFWSRDINIEHRTLSGTYIYGIPSTEPRRLSGKLVARKHRVAIFAEHRIEN